KLLQGAGDTAQRGRLKLARGRVGEVSLHGMSDRLRRCGVEEVLVFSSFEPSDPPQRAFPARRIKRAPESHTIQLSISPNRATAKSIVSALVLVCAGLEMPPVCRQGHAGILSVWHVGLVTFFAYKINQCFSITYIGVGGGIRTSFTPFSYRKLLILRSPHYAQKPQKCRFGTNVPSPLLGVAA